MSVEKKANPPWGMWEVLLEDPAYKVKRITVNQGHRLSYQTHAQRCEHWVIVQGDAEVTVDGKKQILRSGDAINIPMGAAHRIANGGRQPMIFIEVQLGSYLGEDDIVRLEDDYGR